jgi:hypothetical protein
MVIFKGGRVVRQFRYGDYAIALVVGAESPPPIQFRYILVAMSDPAKPWFHVTSEVNTMASQMLQAAIKADPSMAGVQIDTTEPFLCTHDEQGVMTNYGSASDWRDVDRFVAKGMELIKDHYKLEGLPIELHSTSKTLQQPEYPWAKWQTWAWTGLAIVFGSLLIRLLT